jgi:hypothetical protein
MEDKPVDDKVDLSSNHKDLSVKSLLEEAEVDETLNKIENPVKIEE